MFACLVRDASSPPVPGALESIARACSPRVELYGDDVVVCDVDGLTRAIGPPPAIARELPRLAASRGAAVRIALAGTTTAAWLLAHAIPGVTVVRAGDEAAALAGLPIESLGTLTEALGTGHAPALSVFRRWGLRTLGDLARLARAELHTRFGPLGVRLHQAARGEDGVPLVPAGDPRRFIERLELEWPIEGLEPLSFVLARVCETLSVSLERADRGAVDLTSRLRLVTRRVHERTLHLPAPMRDARVLRTLILLDLESHPPDAAIDIVEVELGVTPGAIVQGTLLTRALPSHEDLATLIARLEALMGEARVGAPLLVDTHDERAFDMARFGQGIRQKAQGRSDERTGDRHLSFQNESRPASACSSLLPSAFCLLPCLRRFRLPIAARVTLESGAPVRVVPSARGLTGGRVVHAAGPWRSSGRWWALDRSGWDRDEWDVELSDGLYVLSRDRATGTWQIEGELD